MTNGKQLYSSREFYGLAKALGQGQKRRGKEAREGTEGGGTTVKPIGVVEVAAMQHVLIGTAVITITNHVGGWIAYMFG